MRFNNSIRVLICATILLMFSGCFEKTNAPEDVIEQDLTAGWLEFDKGNYSESQIAFERVLETEEGELSALCGLGWSHSRGGEISKGISYFEKVLKNEDKNSCALAGIGFGYSAVDSNTLSTKYLETLLANSDENISISEALVLKTSDIHKTLAVNYYKDNDVDKLKAHVDLAISDHGVKLDNRSTWKYGSKLLRSYQDALLFQVLN